MKRFLSVIVTTAALCLPGVAAALDWNPPDAPPGTKPVLGGTFCAKVPSVFYINGVNRPTEFGVAQDAELLGRMMLASGQQVQGKVQLLYNPSETLLLDVFRELALQKLSEGMTRVSWMLTQSVLTLFGRPSELSADEKDKAYSALATKVAASILSGPTPAVLQGMEAAVGQQASFSGKVVLVAHSQGNMFANAIYDWMKAPSGAGWTSYEFSKSVEVVNVANPAGTAPSGEYVTLQEDIIINYLARALSVAVMGPQPLPATTSAGWGPTLGADLTGHGFVSVYLNQDLMTASGSMADITISKALRVIERTSPVGYGQGEGPVNVSVLGGMVGADSSIVVTSPDGTEQAFPVSNIGKVLASSCDPLQEGTYKVRANLTPNAIQTPDGQMSYNLSLSLGAKLGVFKATSILWGAFYPNVQPQTYAIPVFDIRVTKNEATQGYDVLYFQYPTTLAKML